MLRPTAWYFVALKQRCTVGGPASLSLCASSGAQRLNAVQMPSLVLHGLLHTTLTTV